MVCRRRRRNRPLALTVGVRVTILAGALSAVKVVLFVLGSGAFLAEHPASDLAWVYLALAVLAAGGALSVVPHLERMSPVVALGRLLAMAAAAIPAAALALELDLLGAAPALLILAHLYNIASEILLWLVAAAWLPAPELRRSTLWVCLATALGGLFGAVAAERLLELGIPAAVTAGTVIPAAFAGLWLRECRRELGDGAPDADTPPEGSAAAMPGWVTVLAHPLAVPLGAASFMLTFVWVLTEFICLASYQLFEPEPSNLSRLLAAVYALLQAVEFAAIVLLAGPATRWISPIWRSLLFPLGSLLTLAWMGRSPGQLGPTLLAHAHTEAISNGLFDPVHASNFAVAPLRLQTRLRALADGICYPLGMAAGGAALLLGHTQVPDASGLQPMIATTLVAAGLFVAVAALTGVMITPSLLNGLGLTTEPVPTARRAQMRPARRRLRPWIRRTKLRDRLLAVRCHGVDGAAIRRRVDHADRHALREAFREARLIDHGGAIRQLEMLLDSRNPETRALAIEALLSLPVRGLFLPFLPALRRRY